MEDKLSYFVILWQEEIEAFQSPAEESVYRAVKSFTANGTILCEKSYLEISKRAKTTDKTTKQRIQNMIKNGLLIQEGEGTKRGGSYPILRIRNEFVKRNIRKFGATPSLNDESSELKGESSELTPIKFGVVEAKLQTKYSKSNKSIYIQNKNFNSDKPLKDERDTPIAKPDTSEESIDSMANTGRDKVPNSAGNNPASTCVYPNQCGKCSKCSLVRCTDLEIWQTAKDKDIPLSVVKNKHDQILEMITSGEFKKKRYSNVYYTLRKWLDNGIQWGQIQHSEDVDRMETESERPDKVAYRHQMWDWAKQEGIIE